MRLTLRLALTLLPLPLTACISAYQPPGGAPTAKVRFQTTATATPMLFVRTQRPGEMTCQQIGHLGTPEQSKIDMIGSAKEPRADRVERLVQAGSPFVVYFQEINGIQTNPTGTGLVGVSCQSPISFTPQPGASYEITHGSDPVAKVCTIQASELTPGANGEAVRRPIQIQPVAKITCL